MARTDQDPKSTFTMESRTEDGSLLHLSSHRDTSPSQDHKYTRRARRLLSPGALGESFLDLLAAIACAYFIVFAALVYSRRDEPLNRSGNEELLDAAKYVSLALLFVCSTMLTCQYTCLFLLTLVLNMRSQHLAGKCWHQCTILCLESPVHASSFRTGFFKY
jgi:hypothetical protein